MQLKAGNFYYIEAVHKERNGGDQMYVSIQHECDATLAECQAANEKYRAEPPYCGEGKNWHRNATTSIALIDGQLYYPDPLFDNVTEADIPVDKGQTNARCSSLHWGQGQQMGGVGGSGGRGCLSSPVAGREAPRSSAPRPHLSHGLSPTMHRCVRLDQRL